MPCSHNVNRLCHKRIEMAPAGKTDILLVVAFMHTSMIFQPHTNNPSTRS